MHALDTPLYVTVTVMMSLHVDWHFGCAPAPLTCLAPSQCAAAVPDVSRVPFMCPSPSHDLTHVPWPPWMRPKLFQHTPPLLDMLPPSQTRPSVHLHRPPQVGTRTAPVPCLCHRALMDTIRMLPPPTVCTSAPTCCPPTLTHCPHHPPTLYIPPPSPSTSHTCCGPLAGNTTFCLAYLMPSPSILSNSCSCARSNFLVTPVHSLSCSTGPATSAGGGEQHQGAMTCESYGEI